MLEFTYYNTENIDDRDAVFDLIEQNKSIKIIADKGYISNNLQSSLANEKEILLISLKRKNSKFKFEKQLRNALSKTLAYNLSFMLNIITGSIMNTEQIKHLAFG